MVLTGRHAVSIGGGITLGEVQVDGVMGIFSLLPWWKAGGRYRSHDMCVVGIATSLLHFVLVGVEVGPSKILPSKYC